MSAAKKSKKKRAGRRRELRPGKFFKNFDRYLALPDEEIRRLAMLITTRDGVEPFMRRMVVILDSLSAGRVGGVTRMALRSKDQPFAELMSAISLAARRGYVGTARTTAFLATSYAYQNSLDYLLELLGYLDRIRRPRGKKPSKTSGPTHHARA